MIHLFIISIETICALTFLAAVVFIAVLYGMSEDGENPFQ